MHPPRRSVGPQATAQIPRRLAAVLVIVGSGIVAMAAARAAASAFGTVGVGTPTPTLTSTPRSETPPPFKSVDPSTLAMPIPLVRGLTLVVASHDSEGDAERLLALTDISSQRIVYRYSGPTSSARTPAQRPATPPVPDCVMGIDLAVAHGAMPIACSDAAAHQARMLLDAPSPAVLNGLRAGAAVEYFFPAPADAARLEAARRPLDGKRARPLFVSRAGMLQRPCVLRRLGTVDVAVPLVLNDEPVTLPALKAESRCANARSDSEDFHFVWYVLDEPEHPIWLAQETPDGSARPLQVVTIAFPNAAASASRIERALASMHPVQLYGVYFDFNSAALREESDSALRDIAAVLDHHHAWKVAVAGHTDLLGDEAFNVALSQRRAAAVKEALTARFHVDPSRLVTNGYGAGRPIDTNTTMEGRARNRRVELRRL